MLPYLTLFLSAFVAASLFPASSEFLLAGMLLGGHEPWLLWAVASTGNTLGAAVNWLLARYFLHYRERRWFPVRADALARAERGFRRYGHWSLLLAWVPIGGDALTFVAGLLRVPFGRFLLLVGIGKAARYAAVIWLATAFAA